ncbi:hypothetical protein ABDD95_09460 [Mucilaginibacter sp. PAMB04274]|uniref:hypothetical protein n=1 Tax=Mucilaginibacter sp. PAMB04274 TaxID=3138568 RepID=UPI0031F6E939
MLLLADVNDWEKQPLINAFDSCIRLNLEYKFTLKSLMSPSKDLLGYIQCYWDIERFMATGIIKRKNGEIIKQELLVNVEAYNGEFIYYAKCRWTDNYTFTLYMKDGNEWSVKYFPIV